MKKYILILLTIALIFLVEIKGEETPSGGEGTGDNDEKNNTTSGNETIKNETKPNETTEEKKPNTNTTNENEWVNPKEYYTTSNGNVSDVQFTAGGLNKPDEPGTKMHLSVLEGFKKDQQKPELFRFNFFGKKYFKAVKFVFVIIIRSGRLRSRLRMRNLETDPKAECDTNEAQLLEKIMSVGSLNMDQAKEKLEATKESMLKCDGSGSGTLGINWEEGKVPEGAAPEEAIKKDDTISDNTGNSYMELLTKGIVEGIGVIHVFGIQDPGSSSKTFKVESYRAEPITGTSSVVSDTHEIKEVNLNEASCNFGNVGKDGEVTMTCDKSVDVNDLSKTADVPGTGTPTIKKEQIYLNLVKSEGSGSNPSDRQYPDKSGSGLSTGGIVAIVIVCVVIVVAIAAISFMLKKKPSIPEENDITNEIDSQARAAPVQ